MSLPTFPFKLHLRLHLILSISHCAVVKFTEVQFFVQVAREERREWRGFCASHHVLGYPFVFDAVRIIFPPGAEQNCFDHSAGLAEKGLPDEPAGRIIKEHSRHRQQNHGGAFFRPRCMHSDAKGRPSNIRAPEQLIGRGWVWRDGC